MFRRDSVKGAPPSSLLGNTHFEKPILQSLKERLEILESIKNVILRLGSQANLRKMTCGVSVDANIHDVAMRNNFSLPFAFTLNGEVGELDALLLEPTNHALSDSALEDEQSEHSDWKGGGNEEKQ